MFKENGRADRPANTERASSNKKEFVCRACKKRRVVLSVEFGEQVICKCGNQMEESYEEWIKTYRHV